MNANNSRRLSRWVLGSVALGLMCLAATTTRADEVRQVALSRLRLLDVRGQSHVLAANEQRSGTAFIFISPECPISRQYVPELNRLSQGVDADQVAFYGILSDASITRTAAEKFADEFDIAFPVLFDASGELADMFQPSRVPEAYVVDAAGEIVYRGRIDDLYADVDKRRTVPGEKNLLAAMTAVAEGREVPVSRTEAIGCLFETPPQGSAHEVTYARDIAPIVFANCAECHRPGEVAPFSLLSYEDVAKRADWIKRLTSSRLMPPWKAVDGHGDFLDARRLSDRQIDLLAAWADAGAPEGDAADLPPQPVFAEGWRLGEPDVIVEAPIDFPVPADGPDIFQHFVMPIDVDEDQTIVAFEFRPGSPSVVHHAIVFLDSRGGSRQRDAQTPEPGWTSSGSVDASITSMLGVWTPGMTPRRFPNNTGIPMEKGTDLVVQLHLHPSGKAETDKSRIGLYFSDEPVKRTMSRSPLVLGTLIIDIPPGEEEYRTGSSFVLPTPITLTSVFPHMHLIAKEMKVTATLPDGKVEPLIWIDDWNFYWQDAYVYRDPVVLPEGTRIDIESCYDNSAENPFNPSSPPKPVRFGNGSADEMCFAIFQTMDEEPGSRRRIGRAQMESLMGDFARSDLSMEARGYIVVEAMKLFGGGGRRELRQLLLGNGRGRSRTADPAKTDQSNEASRD